MVPSSYPRTAFPADATLRAVNPDPEEWGQPRRALTPIQALRQARVSEDSDLMFLSPPRIYVWPQRGVYVGAEANLCPRERTLLPDLLVLRRCVRS